MSILEALGGAVENTINGVGDAIGDALGSLFEDNTEKAPGGNANASPSVHSQPTTGVNAAGQPLATGHGGFWYWLKMNWAVVLVILLALIVLFMWMKG